MLPFGLVYAYSTGGNDTRAIAKKLLRPIKRFVQRKGGVSCFDTEAVLQMSPIYDCKLNRAIISPRKAL